MDVGGDGPCAVLAEAAVAAGITKIRLTGGEPLIRKGVVNLCYMLTEINGLESLSLTTNGIRLQTLAKPLAMAGVKRINVSLDTLNKKKYKQITGRDAFNKVWEGIMAAYHAGLSLKIGSPKHHVLRQKSHLWL